MSKLAVVMAGMAMCLSVPPASAADDMSQFVKAFSYAIAIDEFCFADHEVVTDELRQTARRFEEVLGDGPLTAGLVKARQHLEGDQSACENAEAFVSRVSTPEALGRIVETLNASADAESEQNILAEIEWCRPKIQIATTFVAEMRPFKFTTLPDDLARCVRSLPERADTAELRSQAVAALHAIPAAEAQAAAERAKQEEEAAEKQAAQAAQAEAAEKAGWSAKRAVLVKQVSASNKKYGEQLSVAQYCVYLVSPVRGPVVFTPEVKANVDQCLEGLDPDREADALFYVRKTAEEQR